MPQQQEEFDDESGFIGRVDFFWPEHGVIAEFDGQVKYNDRSSIVSEKLREDRLRELGYEVVRITWSEVLNEPAKVAQRIRAAMGRAAARRRRVAR
jgi:very-short-patch-repair endonuclease